MRAKRIIGLAALAGAVMFASSVRAADSGLKEGKPDIRSAGALAFGPEGILFVGDSQSAAVFAIATGDTTASAGPVNVEDIRGKIAQLLGTSAKMTNINDVAVNPATGNVFLSVSRNPGPKETPVILRVQRSGAINEVSLDNAKFAKAPLPDAPGPEDKDRRGRPKRRESITDLAYVDGRVFIAGLSNEEFASKLRSIPFPFSGKAAGSSVEIYHGAHGGFETNSPVRTFVPFDIDGKAHLLAGYTCTPLVKFAVEDLKPGQHVKGTTVAELGNGNQPLDMIEYEKAGKRFLLIANSRRGIMKVATDGVGKIEGITNPVKRGGTKGLPYDTIGDWKGILQLDKLDDGQAVVLVQNQTGTQDLKTVALP